MTQAYFLTVDWCNSGKRGVFCTDEGACFRKDGEPHDDDEMWEILGPFFVILHPQSVLYTEDELSKLTLFRPLAEYRNQFGIALQPEQI